MLKVKLATAIIGISSIHLLKTFINAAAYDEKTIIAQVGIHITFLLSALAIAWTDRIMPAAPAHERSTHDHDPQDDLIQSVADALQFISYYHPVDYIRALGRAYEREQSPAAKDAIAQILINSRMCAEGHRPICQDTGIVTVFLEDRHGRALGRRHDGLEDMVNEGVRRAYNHPDNKLRASVLADPAGKRTQHEGQHARRWST